MNTTNTHSIAQQFLRHLGGRDLNALVALFAEDVDWYIPGNDALATWTGRRNTQAGVRDFYMLLWSESQPVSAEISHFLVEGDAAVITGSFETLMLRTGRTVASPFSIELKVGEGLIYYYRLLEDSYAVAEALKEGT